MSQQIWPGHEFFVATEYFDVATELAKAGGKCVVTKPVYVATELARKWRIYVTIELATIKSYVAHDRAKSAKVMPTRKIRSGSHDWHIASEAAHTTGAPRAQLGYTHGRRSAPTL